MNNNWLERWLAAAPKKEVLELGCGSGRDTKYLVEQGFSVTATDIRGEALEACAREAPAANHLQLDIRRPLPFADKSYPVIVASLCLHYFSWKQTTRILSEIKRCLKSNGQLLARFNSTNDVLFGAVGFREIEPDFYFVRGKSKRFFDYEDATQALLERLESRKYRGDDDPQIRETQSGLGSCRLQAS